MLIYLEVFCYLDSSSLSKSTQASEESLEGTTEKKKTIILYVVKKVTAESRHTNGNEIPAECPFQLRASSEKQHSVWAGKLTF